MAIVSASDIPTFKWGIVTGVNPLEIKLDGDTAPLALIPDALHGDYIIGDRIRVELSKNRVVVVGKAGAQTTGWLGTRDLNSVRKTGTYIQTANADATAARNYPNGTAGYLEVISTSQGYNGDFLLQRYTDYNFSQVNRVGSLVWERSFYNGVWYPWVPMTPNSGLPAPFVGNGNSAASIGSTGWAAIPGALRAEYPAYTRDLLVDVRFGALGSVSTGYWMIGMSIFQSSGPAWNVPPEQGDPGLFSSPSVGQSLYGLYAQFSQTTTQVGLSGTKRVKVPAGVASVFQMAARKSVASATAVMNYSSMEVIPVAWV